MPAERRGTALGVYYMGPSFGTIVGFSVAGAVAAEFGWRAGFLVAGVPGLVLALLLWRTVREPPRTSSLSTAASDAPPLGEALRILWSIRAARHDSLTPCSAIAIRRRRGRACSASTTS